MGSRVQRKESHRPFVGKGADERWRLAGVAKNSSSEERGGCNTAQFLCEVHVLQHVELRVGCASAREEREDTFLRPLRHVVGHRCEIHHRLPAPCGAVGIADVNHHVVHELRHALEQLPARGTQALYMLRAQTAR